MHTKQSCAGCNMCEHAEQSKGMSAKQLLQLAESLAKKRLTAEGSQGGYECLMLYLHVLKASY